MDEVQSRAAGMRSRRDALKLGGAAALGGVAAALAAEAAGEQPAGAATTPTHVPTSLRVTVNGALLKGVRSMSTNAAAYELTSSTDSTGAWSASPSGIEGQVVSFSRYFTGDPAFLDLYQSQNGDSSQRMTVVVTVLGRKGSIANTFTLSECFPVSWNGPTYTAKAMAAGGALDRPTESISIAFQKIEVK